MREVIFWSMRTNTLGLNSHVETVGKTSSLKRRETDMRSHVALYKGLSYYGDQQCS